MVGHDHGPSQHEETETEHTSARNARVGMRLFLLYLALYVGYVSLVAFTPDTLKAVGAAGVNVAVLYGFGLIVGAFVLALVYGWLCRKGAA